MVFGEDRRSVVDDANANIVEPPAITQTVKAQGVSAQRRAPTSTEGNEVLLGASKTLGEKLQARIAEEQEEERRKQELQGAQDQGEQLAINDIALMNKRTGLGEFLFGQNATYEGAQRRAVENNITSWANEEYFSVEKYAGMTKADYQDRLNQKYTEHAANFEGDPETTLMLQEQYQKASATLMEKWTKEKYIYTQTQNYLSMQEKVAHQTDSLVMIGNDAATPEEQARALVNWNNHFDYDYQMEQYPNDRTITRENFNKIHVANITAQLDKGNVNAYNAAKASGYLDRLPRTSQDAVEVAHRRWSTMNDIDGYKALDSMNVQVESVRSADDVANIESAYLQNMQTHPLIFTAAKLPAVLSRARAYYAKAVTSAAKATKAAAETAADNASFIEVAKRLQGGDTTVLDTKGGYTKAEREAGGQIELLARGTDNKELDVGAAEYTVSQFIDLLQTDPVFVENAARNLRVDQPLSTPEKLFIQHGLARLTAAGNQSTLSPLKDESGQLSPDGKILLQNLYKYDEHHPGILAKAMSSEEDFIRLTAFNELVGKQGYAVVDAVTRIDQDLSEFMDESFTVKTKHGTKNVSQSEYLSDQFEANFGHQPSTAERAHYERLYEMFSRMSTDQSIALRHTNQAWKGNNVPVMGTTLIGGKVLEETLNRYAAAQSTVELTPKDIGVYTLAQNDPTLEGAKIPRESPTINDLMNYIQTESTEHFTLLAMLGLQRNKDTGMYDQDILSRSKLTYKVPYGSNSIIITAGDTGKQAKLDIRELARLQTAYSKWVYMTHRRDEINTEAELRRHDELGGGAGQFSVPTKDVLRVGE